MTSVATNSAAKSSTCPATVADAIEHTLEWLDQQGCSSPDSERRNTRRSRYRVNARILYVPAGGEKSIGFDVTTRNLSRTGLSFIHKTLIYPRQQVEVQLPLPDQSVRHIRGRVIRVRPAGIGLYEIGVEFTELEVVVA
jgi:hypothetical protein